MTRSEKAAKAAELRASGKTHREIAAEMGISLSYAHNLAVDPDGAKMKARKDSYRGTCRECGGKTDGSNGRNSAPEICSGCFVKQQHENRYWTQQRIIDAIKAWHRAHGRPPIAPEWVTPRDRVGEIPPVSTVQREFGTWRAAIIAAGFECKERGKYERNAEWRANLAARSRGPKPERRNVNWELVVRLREEGTELHEIALRAQCSLGTVKRIISLEAPHLVRPYRRRTVHELPIAA